MVSRNIRIEDIGYLGDRKELNEWNQSDYKIDYTKEKRREDTQRKIQSARKKRDIRKMEIKV